MLWGVSFFPYGYLGFQHQLLKRPSFPPMNCLIHCLIGANWGKLLNWGNHSDFYRLLLRSDRNGYLSTKGWLCTLTYSTRAVQQRHLLQALNSFISVSQTRRELPLGTWDTQQTAIPYPRTKFIRGWFYFSLYS